MVMDIHELSDATCNTLQWWLDIHHDPEKWAENWIAGYTHLEALRAFPELENDYFSYSSADDAFTIWARDNAWTFSRCLECDYIFEDDQGCECVDADSEDATIDDVVEFMQDNCDLESLPLNEDQARQLWEGPAFEAYYDAVGPMFAGNAEEIRDALAKIDRATDDLELIAAIETAIEVQHVHGSVVVDYGEQCGIDYEDAKEIERTGVKQFLSEEV